MRRTCSAPRLRHFSPIFASISLFFFVSFSYNLRLLLRDHRGMPERTSTNASLTIELLAGSVAGAAQVIVGQPLDTVKTRAQIAPRMFSFLEFISSGELGRGIRSCDWIVDRNPPLNSNLNSQSTSNCCGI